MTHIPFLFSVSFSLFSIYFIITTLFASNSSFFFTFLCTAALGRQNKYWDDWKILLLGYWSKSFKINNWKQTNGKKVNLFLFLSKIVWSQKQTETRFKRNTRMEWFEEKKYIFTNVIIFNNKVLGLCHTQGKIEICFEKYLFFPQNYTFRRLINLLETLIQFQ